MVKNALRLLQRVNSYRLLSPEFERDFFTTELDTLEKHPETAKKHVARLRLANLDPADMYKDIAISFFATDRRLESR